MPNTVEVQGGGAAGGGGGAVSSVAGRTGDVLLTAGDVGAGQLPGGVLLPSGVIIPAGADISAILGATGATAAAGNDGRLSDTRTPTDGSVTNAKVAAGAAIALSKLASDPLARANHTGTQVMATISDAGALATKSAVASADITDGTIVNADINAAAAIAASKISGTALTLSDLQNAQMGIIFPIAAYGVGPTSTLATWPLASRAHGLRFIIPRAGTIDDISFYVGTSSGNYDLAVLDDGSASAGNRTSLYHKGSTALAGTNVWISNNPALVVTKGQHIDIALQVDNTTATIARYPNVASVQFSQLPSTYIVAPGAAPAKFAWQWPTTLPMTLPVAEASLQGTLQLPFFLVHIS